MRNSHYLKSAVLAVTTVCMLFITSRVTAGSVPSVQNMSPLNQTAFQHLAQKLSSSNVTNIEIVATLTPDNLQIPKPSQMTIVNSSGQPTDSSITPEIVSISGMLSFVTFTSEMDLEDSASNGIACITLPVNWSSNRVDISLGTDGGNGYNSFYLVEVLLTSECNTIGTLQWELRTDSGYKQEVADVTLSSNVPERYLLTDLISLGPLHNVSIGDQAIPGNTSKLTFRLANNWRGSSNLTSFGFKHFRVYRISIGSSPEATVPTGTLQPKPGADASLPTGTLEPKPGTDTKLPTGTLEPRPGTDTKLPLPTGILKPVPGDDPKLPTGTAQPVPTGSDNRGGIFIPETDTEVDTQFESGDTKKPVWTGNRDFDKDKEKPKSLYEDMVKDRKKRKAEREQKATQKELEALEKQRAKKQKREVEKARQEAINKQREAEKAIRKADRKQKALDTLVTEDREQLAKAKQSAQSAKDEATVKQAEADRAKAYYERLKKTVVESKNIDSEITTKPVSREKEEKK